MVIVEVKYDTRFVKGTGECRCLLPRDGFLGEEVQGTSPEHDCHDDVKPRQQTNLLSRDIFHDDVEQTVNVEVGQENDEKIGREFIGET